MIAIGSGIAVGLFTGGMVLAGTGSPEVGAALMFLGGAVAVLILMRG